MHLVILTPEKTYFDGNVNSLLVTTGHGQLGILPKHTDLIAAVEISPLIIKDNGHLNYYSVGGGEMRVSQKENKVILLLSSIEKEDEIDVDRAQKAKEKAEKALEEATSTRDQYRAEVKLKRALNRLKIKNKSFL